MNFAIAASAWIRSENKIDRNHFIKTGCQVQAFSGGYNPYHILTDLFICNRGEAMH
jgi:hypothetical protein